MTFGASNMLVLLIFPALALLALLWDLGRQVRFIETLLSPRLRPLVIPDWSPGARRRKALLWCAAQALIVLALARPQWGTREETVSAAGLDVMIVLDVSRSMDVEDVVPSRLKKSKHWIRSLLDRLRGDRAGLVTFAASTSAASPLTTDIDYVLETVDVLGTEWVGNQGTDIGLGLDTAIAALDRGAQVADDPELRAGTPSRVIILISDGEDHEGAAEKSAERLAREGIRLFVVGVGTEKGGPIPLRDESGRLEGYKRAGGEAVVSQFHPDSLQKVAASGSGRYWNASDSESEIDEILGEIGALQRSSLAERKVSLKVERFQWPLGLAVLLLLLEMAAPLRRSRSAKRAAGLAVLVALSAALPKPALAAAIDSYLKNREGLRNFSRDDTEQALKNFSDAGAADPAQAEPRYNLGVAQLKKGDRRAAIETLESVQKQAGLSGDAALSARSLYNLGSAYESDQQNTEAVRNFARAIRMAEHAGDGALADAARQRIEKLQEQMKQQQQQQKQQDQKQGKQEQSQQGDQQSQSEQQKKQQDQSKNFEDPSLSRKREFKSEKMTPEDSERVMSELSAREKELQARLRRQRGARQVANGKDW